MRQGFTDGSYAAIPFGKTKLVIIFNGYQLETVSTVKQARDFIANHKTVTIESETTKTCSKIKKKKDEPRDNRTTKKSSRTKMGTRSSKTQTSTSSKRTRKNSISQDTK